MVRIGDTYRTLTSYADDIKLFANSESALNTLFDEVTTFLAHFGLHAAPDKSHVVCIGGT